MITGIRFAESPVDGVGGSTPVRPGRSRTRKNVDEKVKPVPGDKKKTPSSRKAPARGRYVDEYALPPGA